MNTLIDDNPKQTLCNVVEAADLLAAVKVEDLTERGEMGMFSLLRDISRATPEGIEKLVSIMLAEARRIGLDLSGVKQ